MRWKRTPSRDVIDMRGGGRRRGGFGGGGFGRGRGRMPMPLPGGGRGRVGGGIGLIAVLLFLAVQMLGSGGSSSGYPVAPAFEEPPAPIEGQPIPASQDPERDLRDFSAYVFTDAQDAWEEIFRDAGRDYDRAKLVLYRGGVRTGCGSASSAVGPFYCPADRRVYLDLSFYRDMERQLQASGDFAWAYVIAHEVGHHVQNLLGTSGEVRRLQADSPDDANELSVRLELQADCYSGVWARSVSEEGALEQDDLEEAITASQAVGDDRLQRDAGGGVDPDSFTHGTSEQRARWFRAGERAGDANACDTFSVDDP